MIDIDRTGTATLRNNWYTTVGITAEAYCKGGGPTGVASVSAVSPNLLPGAILPVEVNPQCDTIADSWDVDMQVPGASLQFPPLDQDESFQFEIFVNADLGDLITFELKIFYNPAHLSISDCSKSGAWNAKTFEANIDGTPGLAYLAGAFIVTERKNQNTHWQEVVEVDQARLGKRWRFWLSQHVPFQVNLFSRSPNARLAYSLPTLS